MAKQQRTTKKRAIALAGGGPAAGLHIGALAALEDRGIHFDIFSLSCIGAWVGIVYNTRDTPESQGRTRAQQTFDFFDQYCFRDDRSYEWFPVNRGFATDFGALARAVGEFLVAPPLDVSKLPPDVQQTGESVLKFLALLSKPTEQEINLWLLNYFFAVNPATRWLTSLIYKSRINGLSRIYYDKSPALEEVFRGKRLYRKDMPDIYHNAWRLPTDRERGRIQIFHNRPNAADHERGYLKITPESLCACSALPYIEESVKVKGTEYTEGALVDTVNFVCLMRDHDDLDEIWVSRIVDESQVKPARDLAGALANLPMQFAAEVGEDDIKLFRQHLLNQTTMRPRVVEIPIHPRTRMTFEWKHSNLQQGFQEGYEAVTSLLRFDPALADDRLERERAGPV